MKVEEQIIQYIESLPEQKRSEMLLLHQRLIKLLPKTKLWFLDGKDENGKVVTNPNIGYGNYLIHYKDGSSKEFYQIGISSNSTGISVYIMGLQDKNALIQNFGTTIGKASVTGYCIKFKKPDDINLLVLDDAIRYGVKHTS